MGRFGRIRPPRARTKSGLVGLVLALGCASGDPVPERIVLIVVDTLRADFASCCREGTATPNLDGLARRGQRFPNAVASYHQTTASMGALFTGHTPSFEMAGDEPMPWNGKTWCGMARFAGTDEAGCLPAALPTLPEVLKEAGYWTIGITSNELLFAPAGFERGFDDWSQVSDPLPRGRKHIDDIVAQRLARVAGRVNAAAFAAVERRPSDRFFLYVHYMDAHDYQERRDAYAEGVMKVDVGVGELLATLETQGLIDGSVVILSSDHGERIGEEHLLEGRPEHRGKPSFEEVLRVPLIIAPPRFDDPERLVRSQDLFDIIARIGGAETKVSRDLEPASSSRTTAKKERSRETPRSRPTATSPAWASGIGANTSRISSSESQAPAPSVWTASCSRL